MTQNLNVRQTVLEALEQWGYSVSNAEYADINLENGDTIELQRDQRSVLVDSHIYNIRDDEDFDIVLEAANLLNNGFFFHTQVMASDDSVSVTAGFDYSDRDDLRFRLLKALILVDEFPRTFRNALKVVRSGDTINVGPIWDEVKRINLVTALKVMAGKTVLYIHGFASSGKASTAARLRELLPATKVLSPDLPVNPDEAIAMLRDIIDKEKVDLVIGTSMGGMFANLLDRVPRILINPSFHVSKNMRKKIGTVQFLKERGDGATEFEVTEQLCNAYEALERKQFEDFDNRDTGETFALFGSKDDVVDCREEYIRYYGDAYTFVPCGHRLSEEALVADLVPAMTELVGRNRL
ncbi:MAG: hypothetical protein NC336_07255 [Clostridium sp.]|nr:hypothetical protein [Clostridium sp.]